MCHLSFERASPNENSCAISNHYRLVGLCYVQGIRKEKLLRTYKKSRGNDLTEVNSS